MNYIGPTILGRLARVSSDPQVRSDALDEGENILREGCVSHNYLWFYRDAMEVALDAGEWNGVERYAAALEDYARPEPLPWSDFFVARGRALATWGRGRQDKVLVAKLRYLCSEAHRLQLALSARRLDDVLRAA
jgi:hypothetical protein